MPRRAYWQTVAVGSILASGVLGGRLAADVLLAGTVLLGILVAVDWRFRRRSPEDTAGASGSDGPAWNLIPARRYTGRHVGSGGLARAEQERLLESIQQDATEIDSAHDDADQP